MRTRKTTQTGTRMSSSRRVMLMIITAARLICSLGVGISPLGSLRDMRRRVSRRGYGRESSPWDVACVGSTIDSSGTISHDELSFSR